VAKRCRNQNCAKLFEPTFSSLQVCCSYTCAAEWAKTEKGKAHAEKAARKEHRERKAKLKTRSEWLSDVQKEFNAYIRERDKNQPCISCNRQPNDGDLLTGSRWDCGHYRSVGACPELRFNELNAHKQCVNCNRDKSGNIVEYRINLVNRIGRHLLHWLEGPHEPKKYTIAELKELKAIFKKKRKEAEKADE